MARLTRSAPVGRPVDISTMTLPDALACALAAARSGIAVLVADLAQPITPPLAVPRGTWLIATTSGTTRRPRAICRTASSWAASIGPLADLAGVDAADTVLLTGPLHSTLHLHAAVHTLCIGAHLTDEPSTATVAHCVPTVLDRILRSRGDYPRLRKAIVAGAPATSALVARAGAAGLAVTEYYGAAELSFVAARRWPDPLLRPFPGTEVRVDDEGVIWVRSPYRAFGYLELAATVATEAADGAATDVTAAGPDAARDAARHAEPDALAVKTDAARDAGVRVAPDGAHVTEPDTSDAATDVARCAGRVGANALEPLPMEPLRTDEDGFVTVGDVVDAPSGDPSQGFTVRGRADSAITTGGFTVLTADIEAALSTIPRVRAVGAVGLDHPRLGQVVAVAIELVDPSAGHASGKADLADIRAAARALLPHAARPRKYLVVDALPRTPSGKVAHAALADLFHPAP
ncbi:MAG: hypothetical protein BGO26_06115 [Actinobacteria bacterium 69-20]|jgi:acyl-CoA synthetase (AMP-forming)/AMP-acid ligase II|nr:AMP-binding protein [Actinomycetota bacterium]OJV28034.1 MAG: hypothetical protein BGO26_06115 [Actinobacteria bacterium 69-20]